MTTTAIKSITRESYTGKVYNLEVEPNHPTQDDQFYVCTDTGIVVHNCHPRDNIALRHLADELEMGYDLFDSVMHSREIQAKNMAQCLINASEVDGKTLPIVIVGKTYKPLVTYCDGSASMLVGHYVEELGGQLLYHDYNTGDLVDPEKIGPAVYLLAHDPAVTYGNQLAEVETFMINRNVADADQAFRAVGGLDKIPVPGSILVDPWRKVVVDEILDLTVIHYGNTRGQGPRN